MIATLLALAIVSAPDVAPTTTTTISTAELAELRAESRALAASRVYVAALEEVHARDLARVRTLTAPAETSPVLRGLALGGLALGAAGGLCTGEATDETLQAVCRWSAVGAAAVGVMATVVEILSE